MLNTEYVSYVANALKARGFSKKYWWHSVGVIHPDKEFYIVFNVRNSFDKAQACVYFEFKTEDSCKTLTVWLELKNDNKSFNYLQDRSRGFKFDLSTDQVPEDFTCFYEFVDNCVNCANTQYTQHLKNENFVNTLISNQFNTMEAPEGVKLKSLRQNGDNASLIKDTVSNQSFAIRACSHFVEISNTVIKNQSIAVIKNENNFLSLNMNGLSVDELRSWIKGTLNEITQDLVQA